MGVCGGMNENELVNVRGGKEVRVRHSKNYSVKASRPKEMHNMQAKGGQEKNFE